MKTTLLLAVAMLTLTGCHCASSNHSADEAKLRQLDADWVKAAATHNPDVWDAFYADNAVVLPPNEKTLTDKASIHKEVAELLSAPDLALTWTTDKVVIADAGDMAYIYGRYTLSVDQKGGTPMKDTGKTVEVWRKQSDGLWKCALDAWSSDMPLVQA